MVVAPNTPVVVATRARTVGIDETAMSLLDRWMDVRGRLGIRTRSRNPVFSFS